MTSVVWFRRDLRLEDNTALKAAFEQGDDLILLFHINPQQFIKDSLNHHAFFSCLNFFRKEVNKELHLHILCGNLEECFANLKKKIPEWEHIFFNQDDTGYGAKRDESIMTFFKDQQITPHVYFDHYLHSPDEILTNDGSKYKVFTPYYKKWIKKEKPKPVSVKIIKDRVYLAKLFPSDEKKLDDLLSNLSKQQVYEYGTKAAKKQLTHFSKKIAQYKKDRDIPSKDGTSQLSAYLRSGEISIRTVWKAISQQRKSEGRDTFLQELCWRDFYHIVYTENPNQKEEALKSEFGHITWKNNKRDFKKWQEGQTGFPIVDAGMRQLKETGWMHNRLRMIVASFLVKDLLIDWRWGEKYFQQALRDYDPASNIGGWQWAASTGTDPVPYFRIFNPITQSEKFDPNGIFIRAYVPELKNLPKELIHEPSRLSVEEQKEYKIQLGTDYPHPLVDHKKARQAALDRYEESKEWHNESS